jgi:hypothetical protein
LLNSCVRKQRWLKRKKTVASSNMLFVTVAQYLDPEKKKKNDLITNKYGIQRSYSMHFVLLQK